MPIDDINAEQVLRQVSTYFSALHSFKMRMVATITTEMGGMKQDNTSVIEVSYERSDKIKMIVKAADNGATLIANGSVSHLYVPQFQSYRKIGDRVSLFELFSDLEVAQLTGNIANISLLEQILAVSPYDAITGSFTTIKYSGLEKLDRKCHKIRFASDQAEVDLRVYVGEPPLFKMLTADMTSALKNAAGLGMLPADLTDMKLTQTITYSEFVANPSFDKSEFEFVAPSGAALVESFESRLAQHMPGSEVK